MAASIDIRSLEYGRSFWREAHDRVMRDPLALAGLAVIWFIANVGVFAPLIATDKPYAIRVAFPERYENAYWVWRDSHQQLTEAISAPKSDPARVEKNAGLILKFLGEMASQAPQASAKALADKRKAYAAIFRKVRDLGGAPPTQDIESQLDETLKSIGESFEPGKVTLIPQTRWPAFRALSGMEIAFMVFWLLANLAYVTRGLRFHLSAYGAAVAIGVLAGSIWSFAVPPYNDPTPYRALVEAKSGAPEAVLPPVFFGENENLTAEGGLPPSWWRLTAPVESLGVERDGRARAARTHWMGTDDLGKDVLCRMIYGARVSMVIGLVAVGIYVSIGIIVGALAGYFGGWIDISVSRLIEVMMCFPVFFLILSIVAYARPSIVTIMVVLGVTGWTGTARLQRGEFLRLGEQDFVQAVRGLGGSHLRIIFRHILPNGIAPILVVASFGIASAILTESALSYLGFGVPQPHASWGNLLNSGAGDIRRLWWLIFFPGAAIFITITAWNLFGEVLRDALDPRLRD